MKIFGRYSLAFGCAILVFATNQLQAAELGVTDTAIILGQSAPFSGAAAHLGEQFNRGAQVFFDRINAQGGDADFHRS